MLLGVNNMKKQEQKGILDAKELAAYISDSYSKSHDYNEISKIKLQKSLYFLFAMWGGMIRKSKCNPDYVEENLSSQNEYLFSNTIEAWVYGPVVPDVYRAKELNSNLENAQLVLSTNKFLKETIDSILLDVFSIADFKLVSISHEDNCWKQNFNFSDETHNKEIDKELIINEYAARESL